MDTPKFIVDVNVGRLAKWLRVIGYDTLFVPDIDDSELLRAAAEQGRVVVTRDRYILERRVVTRGEVQAVLVRSDDFREQMRQLTEDLQLGTQGEFSLCIECNAPLRDVDTQAVQDTVPQYVFQTQDRFLRCPACGKLYWRGTHWRNMAAEVASFNADAP